MANWSLEQGQTVTTCGPNTIWIKADYEPLWRQTKHAQLMRLESLRLALDTVVAGDRDGTGQQAASDALLVAARYLEYIENGPKPERGGKRGA